MVWSFVSNVLTQTKGLLLLKFVLLIQARYLWKTMGKFSTTLDRKLPTFFYGAFARETKSIYMIYGTRSNGKEHGVVFTKKEVVETMLDLVGYLPCYICSNRWLKNQYGESLRKLVSSAYHLSHIIDLENTNPFQEAVIAYPAITLISNSTPNTFCNFYEIDDLALLSKSFIQEINSIINHKTISEYEIVEGQLTLFESDSRDSYTSYDI